MTGSPSVSNVDRIAENYNNQLTRIQITSEWKDACIQQEIDEVEKLEKFIQEERIRAH